MPHGHSFLWRSDILWMHAASDILIAFAYYSIPFVLFRFGQLRKDIRFPWVFYLFAAFILACGTSHLMLVFTLWHPFYYLEGLIKGVTAILSLITAIKLWSLLPQALALPSPQELKSANDQLLKVIDERQKAGEIRFRLALEASPQAILVAEESGRIEYANAQTVSLFGYKVEELVGQQLDKLIPSRFKGGHTAKIASFMSAPRARAMGPHSEVFGQHRSGNEFPVEIALGPFHADGKLFVIAYINDISQRKEADLRIQEQASALERSNQDLESFAYAASHDLQEPLRAVMGYLQLLQRQFLKTLPDKAIHYLSRALDGGTRMKTLMDALLQYSRAGRDRGEEEIDLNVLVREIIRDLGEPGLEMPVQFEIGSLPKIRYNPVTIRQVFQNLLSNAVKFRIDQNPQVQIGLLVEDSERIFYVADNGIGISPEFHERIFQLFQRLHSRGEYPGSGIGLAMVAKGIRSRGGRMWMKSQPGLGTTFYFTLKSDNLTG